MKPITLGNVRVADFDLAAGASSYSDEFYIQYGVQITLAVTAASVGAKVELEVSDGSTWVLGGLTLTAPGIERSYAKGLGRLKITAGSEQFSGALHVNQLQDGLSALMSPGGRLRTDLLPYAATAAHNGFRSLSEFGPVDTTGETDCSGTLQAAFNALYSSGGGELRLPTGKLRCDTGIFMPHGATLPWDAKACVISGSGADKQCTSGSGQPPNSGTILDFRSSGAQTACLELWGQGSVEIRGVTFAQFGTAHASPYILVGNTIAKIENCSFFGHSTKSLTTCDQDAVVFGGVNTEVGVLESSPFQGYGSAIVGCHFDRIRRAAWLRTYANAVVIRDNCVWNLCGSAVADAIGAFEMVGLISNSTVGCLLSGNLIEMTGYVYGIRCRQYTLGNVMLGNSFYDYGPNVAVPIRFDAGSNNNIVIAGYAATSVPHVSDAEGTSSIITSNGDENNPSYIRGGMKIGGTLDVEYIKTRNRITIQPNVSQSDATQMVNLLRSAAESSNPGTQVFSVLQNGQVRIGGTDAGYIFFQGVDGAPTFQFEAGQRWKAAGVGGTMEINSGTGGSYLDMKNYAVRFFDHNGGPLRARIGAGGDKMDFGAALDATVQRAAAGVINLGKLAVTNSAAATTPGSCVKKIEVFDGSGASLGFVPVYSSIA